MTKRIRRIGGFSERMEAKVKEILSVELKPKSCFECANLSIDPFNLRQPVLCMIMVEAPGLSEARAQCNGYYWRQK